MTPAQFGAILAFAARVIPQPSALMRLVPRGGGGALWVVFGPVPRALQEAIRSSM